MVSNMIRIFISPREGRVVELLFKYSHDNMFAKFQVYLKLEQ